MAFGCRSPRRNAGNTGGPETRRCRLACWRECAIASWRTNPSKSLPAGIRRIAVDGTPARSPDATDFGYSFRLGRPRVLAQRLIRSHTQVPFWSDRVAGVIVVP